MQLINFEYMQYIDHLKIDLKLLPTLLKNKGVSKWCYIIHDKDVDNNGQLKKPHIHLMCQLEYARRIEDIASWFNDNTQYINKLKTQYKYAIGYLIHHNQDNKYQYDASQVISNFKYEVSDKQYKNTINEEETFFKLLNDYATLKITRKQLNEYLKDKFYFYDKYKKKIDNAIMYRQKIMIGDRDMKVLYINGASGSGKTLLAKYLATIQNYDFFVSGSGKDILDGYDKEECIILDDLRGDVFTKAELFKLLDNNTNSSVKSRYSNKDISNCKLLIITSVKTPYDIYNWVEEEEKEPFSQLSRRLQHNYIKIDNDNIYTIELGKSIHYHDNVGIKAPFSIKDVKVSMNINDTLKENYSVNLLNQVGQKLNKKVSSEEVVFNDSDNSKKTSNNLEEEDLPF